MICLLVWGLLSLFDIFSPFLLWPPVTFPQKLLRILPYIFHLVCICYFSFLWYPCLGNCQEFCLVRTTVRRAVRFSG